MRIYLVRHAESTDNYRQVYGGAGRDVDLTELGMLQAKELANVFDGLSVRSVYSSPLLRAFRTASEILNRCPSIELNFSDLIIEKHFGSLEGRSHRIKHGEPVGEESYNFLARRVETFYLEILKKQILHMGHTECVVVVSHGVTLDYLLRVIFKDLNNHGVYTSGSFLSNATYHLLEIDAANEQLISAHLNIDSHLVGVKKKMSKILVGTKYDAKQTRMDLFCK
ncbi:histidine phosphatase superfamily [Lipomyces chichibuensis]|uniref:histidine phosphatase superfamily n=1 Tax=Lipomyces chichibuensis TaxID=1546026 RepID=UPI0033431BC7